MAQMTKSLAEAVLTGAGISRNELEQLCNFFINNNKCNLGVTELNEELIFILGRPNFWCSQIADWLRCRGQDIPKKAECEHAHVIHLMLSYYERHGAENWRKAFQDAVFYEIGTAASA